MTLLQAVLIGCVAALARLEGDWLGECKMREPIVTGFLVGLVLGDLQTGLVVGAALQLMWMGATGIGPTAQLDIGTGGTIGAAVAIMTHTGSESAILFAVPVAVIMQFLDTLLLSSYSGLMLIADRKAEALDFKGVNRIHYLCGFLTFLLYFSLTTLAMYFGNSTMEAIVKGIPDWANAGLHGVAALLPCLGFALLLNIIMEKKLIPYFVLGFIPAAFIGFDISMVGIAAIAISLAAIIYMVNSNTMKSVQAVPASSDNEWED